MNRSEIREQAFKLIYSLEIQNIENLEEQIELYIESNNITDKNAIEYIKDSVLGIKKNEKDIMQKIEINLKSDWKIERISKIDLAILKIAIYEIKYKDIQKSERRSLTKIFILVSIAQILKNRQNGGQQDMVTKDISISTSIQKIQN